MERAKGYIWGLGVIVTSMYKEYHTGTTITAAPATPR